MQNFAFLLTAHTDVKQLLRLMSRLLSLGDVYLLIDKKQKDREYLAEVDSAVRNSGGGDSPGGASHKHCVGRLLCVRGATATA